MPVPVQAVVGIRRNGSAFSASAVHVHLLLGLRRATMSPSVADPSPPANSPEIEAPARIQTPGSVPRQQQQQHVLVVGGGLVGLTIAQGLKRRGIPCTVFERDAGQHGRLQGWSITIHWGLSALEQVLPRELFDELISVGRSLHS